MLINLINPGTATAAGAQKHKERCCFDSVVASLFPILIEKADEVNGFVASCRVHIRTVLWTCLQLYVVAKKPSTLTREKIKMLSFELLTIFQLTMPSWSYHSGKHLFSIYT